MFMRIPIYMHHVVLPEDDPGFDPYLGVTPERLRGHIRALRKAGISLITLNEARRRILGHTEGGGEPGGSLGPGPRKIPRSDGGWPAGRSAERGGAPRAEGRAAVLTFDDAAEPFMTHALPVLEEEGAPATIFVIAGPLEGRKAHHLPRGAGRPLTPEGLRGLPGRGIEIGSHGMTHRELPGLPPVEIKREVAESRTRLREISGTDVTAFSYPRGRIDPAVRDAVEAAGYLCACGVRRGNHHAPADIFALDRIRAGMDLSPLRLRWTSSAAYDWAQRRRRRRAGRST